MVVVILSIGFVIFVAGLHIFGKVRVRYMLSRNREVLRPVQPIIATNSGLCSCEGEEMPSLEIILRERLSATLNI